MTRSPATRRRAAAAALLLALALGACGGGQDTPEGTTGEPSDAAPTTAPGGDEAASDAEAGDAVDIVEFQYKPENLKASVGAPVTFTNKDEAPHTVTAKDKSYDSGNMAKDATFQHTFDKPGTYEYFCAIHNYMTGRVTVA